MFDATSFSLTGKRALVTGASGALGTAIARRLARDGASLLLHASSRPDAVEALAEAIRADGGTAECHVFDLRSDEATAAGCAAMLAGGPVQIVVNNAGVHDDAVMPGAMALTVTPREATSSDSALVALLSAPLAAA